MGITARARASPEPSELVSLAERAGTLGVVRVGFVLAVLGIGVSAPRLVDASRTEIAFGSAVYLLLLLTPWVVGRGSRARARWVIAGGLLVDGVYLAWLTYATGGSQSALRYLILLHIVAVTLLVSRRTGVKVAAWHSLLFFVVAYAQAADILAPRDALLSALPGGARFVTVSTLQVTAMWVAAIVTAACSSVNERELRAQKVDLERLSSLVRDLEQRRPVSEMADVLLESLFVTFGFTRGVVLASPHGELAVLASRNAGEVPPPEATLDPVIGLAWSERRAQLVRKLDERTDPLLAALLPDAHNVLVVPLLVDQGFRLGVVAVQAPGRRPRVKRWVVTLVEQFASHSALALHGAWLRSQLEFQLEENRGLQQRLLAQNLELELTVQERTTDLRSSLRDLQAADEQRRRLLARLVHAEEEERQRIAGDIHDDPIQKMVAASMRLQLLRRQLSDPEAIEALDKLLESVRTSIKSMRHLIFELRPSVLDEEGLAAALKDYLESLEAEFEFRVDDQLQREPSPEIRVVLYRLAQEAMVNVHKHARAHRVDVAVLEREGGFAVRITDDGVGFSSSETMRPERGHLGLGSMRERAEMAGGWCRLHSLPGEGATVEFWIPAPSPNGSEKRGRGEHLSLVRAPRG